jgi:integrase
MRELPKGVLIKNGYVQVTIMHRGQMYYKTFGRDSSIARQLAGIHAAEKYKEILMGRAGIKKEPMTLKFKTARALFYDRHYETYRDPETGNPRTEGSKCSAKGFLVTLGHFFDNFYLQDIKVATIKRYQDQRLDGDKVTKATFNREKGMLSSVFTQFKRWAAEEVIDPIKLPEENPCEFVKTMQENKRTRVADTWELAEAYTWCQNNDYNLWETIEKALLTALRKGDLVGLDGSLTVKGIQQKTGEKFDLPITLDKPVDVVNFDRRWDALRKAMGWMKGQAKHTTWHDLRHWAPTLLGEQGFSIKIIQHYTGHKKEETAERYVNMRRKSLEPAVDVVQRELKRIKEL